MSVNSNLRHYIGLLIHWAWVVILAAGLSGGVAYVLSNRQQRMYQAATTISVNEAPVTTASGGNYQAILSSGLRALTYKELLTASPLLQAVIQKLGLQLSVDQLKEAVDVQSVRSTQLLKINVKDTNPKLAADLANTIATIFATQRQQNESARYLSSEKNLKDQMATVEQDIQQNQASIKALSDSPADQATRVRLESTVTQYRQTYANLLESYEQVRIAEAQSSSSVVQEEPANVPARPVSPRVMTNTLLAMVVGLFLSLLVILLLDRLDDSVKTPDGVRMATGLPILGAIAEIKKQDKRGPIVESHPRAPVAEAFRALRTNIQYASVDRPLRTLMVTSPSPDEGKSTLVANLGAVVAQSGHSVLLVDADLRRPTLHKQLKLFNRGGLSDLFVHFDVHVAEAIRNTLIKNVSIITAGGLPPNPAELMASQKMTDILHEATQHATLVLIDTPPVNAVTDPAVLASRVDGVLLVVRAGETKITALKQAVDQLTRAGARIIGVVINDIPVGRSGYSYAYQGYYYSAYYSEDDGNDGSRKRVQGWFRRKPRRKQQQPEQRPL